MKLLKMTWPLEKGLVALGVQHNNYTIYAHINKINQKVYIGQTNQKKPEYRWGKEGQGYKRQTFYKAIKKYGWDNFEHIILETDLTQEEANEKEQYYIEYFNSQKNGYNETDGGKNRRLSEEEKQAISIFMRNKQLGKNNNNHKSIVCLNTKQIFDTIQSAADWCNIAPENISQSCKKLEYHSGKHPDTNELLFWAFEKDYTPEIQSWFENNKNKLLMKKIPGEIKKVAQIDINTEEIINIYNNCTEAAEAVFNDKSKHKGISRCALGQRNKAYGYKWRYIK